MSDFAEVLFDIVALVILLLFFFSSGGSPPFIDGRGPEGGE